MQRRYVLIGGSLSVLLLALGLGLYASWIALTRHLDQPFDLHEPLIFDLRAEFVDECHRLATSFRGNGYSEARCVLP